ncbi:hypothetical protein [Kangiella sp.]|uniref:hypothetical protein n=1 Tax=Kangiella sp. TaxID=1920245 RepID=UPI0019A0BD01|nr:hypothetical protein [Kangiella sp.]MBD3653255.1 hypothetical protein [Kangiella sp.]
MDMKKKRQYLIKNKVFHKEDIFRLEDLIFNIYEQFVTSEYEIKSYEILIESFSNEHYSFENEKVQEATKKILEIKHIRKIQMSFYCNQSARVELLLLASDSSYDRSSVVVDGRDEHWVDSTFNSLMEVIDAVENQSTSIKFWVKFIKHFVAINIGWLISYLFVEATRAVGYKSNIRNDDLNPLEFLLAYTLDNFTFFKYIILFLMVWLIGLWFMLFFWDKTETKIVSLWPKIEFMFGNHKNLSQKKKRAFMNQIGVIVILPLILNILVVVGFNVLS